MARNILYAFLLFLLFPSIDRAQIALPKKVLIVGACKSDADRIMKQIKGLKNASLITEVYVVCNDVDWQRLIRKSDMPPTTVTMSDWSVGRVFVGPRAFNDSVLLRHALEHEIEHLACKCSLGESQSH